MSIKMSGNCPGLGVVGGGVERRSCPWGILSEWELSGWELSGHGWEYSFSENEVNNCVAALQYIPAERIATPLVNGRSYRADLSTWLVTELGGGLMITKIDD